MLRQRPAGKENSRLAAELLPKTPAECCWVTLKTVKRIVAAIYAVIQLGATLPISQHALFNHKAEQRATNPHSAHVNSGRIQLPSDQSLWRNSLPCLSYDAAHLHARRVPERALGRLGLLEPLFANSRMKSGTGSLRIFGRGRYMDFACMVPTNRRRGIGSMRTSCCWTHPHERMWARCSGTTLVMDIRWVRRTPIFRSMNGTARRLCRSALW